MIDKELLSEIVNQEDVFNAFIESSQEMTKIYNESHEWPDTKDYIDKLTKALPIEVKHPTLNPYPFILEFISDGYHVAMYIKLTDWDKDTHKMRYAQLFARLGKKVE